MPYPVARSAAVLLGLAAFGGCVFSDPGAAAGGTGLGGNSSGLGSTAGGTTQVSAADDVCVRPAAAEQWQADILALVNQERAAAGLPALARSETLERQAEGYACELAYYDFFDHENPVTGSTLADRAELYGYDYRLLGENLAAGQPTPEQAVSEWMNSPGHRANILNEGFTELGVGVITGGRYGIYWVQEFGRPAR